MAEGQTTQISACLHRLRAGDEQAREELLRIAAYRLEALARRMISRFPNVRSAADTGDVCQNAWVRLRESLERELPVSTAHFCNLAVCVIRSELLDLARKQARSPLVAFGQRPPAHGDGDSPPALDPPDSTDEPHQLAQWAEFHDQVGLLPEAEKQVFELRWYLDLGNEEIAQTLDIVPRTVIRRWQSACLKLETAMKGKLPGADE